MQLKGIKERRISWDQFKKYFKEKYLSVKYYDNKMKYFNELKLGQKSMEEHIHKFLEMLRYVDVMQPSPKNSQKRVYIDKKRVIHTLIIKNIDK